MSKKIIKNRAGNVVDITDSAQLAALFLELVPDPTVRSILFGTPLGVPDDRLVESLAKGNLIGEAGVIGVMRNTITLAFVVVLCRWKQLYEDSELVKEEHIEYFRNARFSKLFLSAMGKEDITLDLQIFALMELWICLKKADDVIRGRFANIYSMSEASMDIGLTLQKVREALKGASYKTLEAGKFTLEYCNGLCYELLRMFTFLRALKINVPSDVIKLGKHDLSMRYALNFEEDVLLYPNDFYETDNFILTEDQLVVKSGKKLLVESDIPRLYLLVETSAFTGKLQHTYRSFDGERETRVEVEEKEHGEVSDAPIEGKDTINDVKEMRKFLSFNYKNIRDFAIIISDALKNSSNKKKKIFDICKAKYPKIIPDTIKSYESPELYWDNIVTLILVEMGPSDFLEQIVDEDIIFKIIMENIEWRCIGYDDAVSLKREYYENLSELEKWCGQNPSVFTVQCTALKTKTILKAMGFGIDENRGVHPFEESLSFKFNNILSCIDTLKQYYRNLRGIDVEKCDKDRERLKDIFKNIFAFLQVFYSGLDRYAMTKQIETANKLPESSDNDDQKQEPSFGIRRNEARKKCFEAFAQAAAEKYIEIKDQGLSEIFEGFCKLCEKYNKSAKNSFNISEEAKRLKFLITRNYICDVEKLRYYTDITLSNGTKSTIFKMLENFSDTYYRDPSYKNWLDYFIDVFLFLIYNEDYNEHGLYHEASQLEDKDCDPIYPYLVTYYRENVDRDNLKKCTYRVPVPTGGKEVDPRDQGFIVTLLTEEEYNPSTYFCIPLRYGSSESWWINPFLIPKGFVRRMYDFIEHKNLYKKDN